MKITTLPIIGTLALLFAASSPNQASAETVTENTNTKTESQTCIWPFCKKKKHKDTKEAKADEIKVLPGWQQELPSRMFSGLVDAGAKPEGNVTYQLHEHYFFVESEGDPLKDPLVIWTNGGPGASSMFGLFVELGPFYLSSASRFTQFAQKTGIPSLFRNDHSWSKLANILIINSPPPVGYSYCDPAGPAGDGYSCGTWDDEHTAYHNSVYLESFFRRFPKFKDNDYYITGESYAGVYVPTLVRHILDHSKEVDLGDHDDDDDNLSTEKKHDKESWSLKKNLKGFAVGDGCMGTKNVCGRDGPGPLLDLEFLHGHGQFSDKLYRETFDICSMEDLVGFQTHNDTDNFGPGRGVSNSTCRGHLKKIEDAVGPFYSYNLYDACWYQNDLEPPTRTSSQQSSSSGGGSRNVREGTVSVTGALSDYPCGGDQAFFDWVMMPQVKKALHVAPDANFFSGDNGIGFTYTPSEPDLMPFYHRVVNETDLRVLVYNGDTDPAINSFTAQNWTSHLGIPETEAWRPWTVDGKQYIGGYVTRYANNFDFLTVRGAGHMVPQHKPRVTFEFLSKWLRNEEWQGVNTLGATVENHNGGEHSAASTA